MVLTPEQLATLRATPVGASGNRLQTAIDLAGTTQTGVAKALGHFGSSRVSDLVNGRTAPRIDTARLYARLFGCAIEDLWPARDQVAC